VLEEVTYTSGVYTYHYALDNRGGSDSIQSVAILVAPNVFIRQLPIQGTAPVGFVFVTSFGGGRTLSGTYQEWSIPQFSEIRPGVYLSGFSLSTPSRRKKRPISWFTPMRSTNFQAGQLSLLTPCQRSQRCSLSSSS